MTLADDYLSLDSLFSADELALRDRAPTSPTTRWLTRSPPCGPGSASRRPLRRQHARKARQICLDARDILGGNGLLLENHVARHLTDMEVVHTYEGTDNIQALLVGRDITGISAFA